MKTGPKLNTYGATESDYATTYLQEYVRCGKANCQTCSAGTEQGHGPYWYAYHYSPALKRRFKKYIGKKLPANVELSSHDGNS